MSRLPRENQPAPKATYRDSTSFTALMPIFSGFFGREISNSIGFETVPIAQEDSCPYVGMAFWGR